MADQKEQGEWSDGEGTHINAEQLGGVMRF